MKKNLIRILCIILTVITASTLFACADETEKKLEEMQSGERMEINDEILKIEESFKLKSEKNGYIPGATIKIAVNGYPEYLSYFEGKVTFIWKYDYLNDKGDYVPDEYKVSIDLDASGKGSYKGTLEFDNARSIKDIELTVKYDGFAIKK